MLTRGSQDAAAHRVLSKTSVSVTQALASTCACCVVQRKKTAVVTKRQKDELMKLVEKAKTCTGDKAVETLKKAINSQLT